MPFKSYIIVATLLVFQLVGAQAGDMHTDSLRPIIAQVVSRPEEFAGKKIEIYGLVVDSSASKKTFMLQDVSQRPFLVDGRVLPPIKTGDQVEVVGFVKHVGQDVFLVAKSVKRVKVTAGGGCC